jgi:hypothetical protein
VQGWVAGRGGGGGGEVDRPPTTVRVRYGQKRTYRENAEALSHVEGRLIRYKALPLASHGSCI